MVGRILVVDDEKALVLALKGLLSKEGYQVDVAYSGEEAIEKIEPGAFHLIITDLSLGGLSGMDVLAHARGVDVAVSVIMITAYGSEKIAVDAMKLGACDYIPKPFDNDEVRVMVRKVMETALLRSDHQRLLQQVQEAYGFEQIVGKSPAMQNIFSMIEKVADTDITVLVRGPSGTGKELVANAVHYRSSRRARTMVKMNCAALSQELVESELFGHEKGAFTGAVARREGKFEAANGGTLFLDEVGDMPLETQAKLLRAIQEREFERVGGNQPIKVDVRLIAATNQDLEAGVRAGTFREDLYYRLKVVEVVLPALIERRDDIPLLIDCFLKTAAERFRRDPKPFTGEALGAALAYEWPGNVRELKSAVEQALLLSSGAEITAGDLLGTGSNGNGHGSVETVPADGPPSFREAKERTVQNFERRFLEDALRRSGGNITRAAEAVGMYRQSFQQKMRELGLTAAEAMNGAQKGV
ncbi:MAG: sigma-54 dependent transcriptional regulator [Candidatus Binatia bacterium]|nr:sigma-54 dependent transcriptional regulator [Candidatus Binatia bacterium]